MYMPYLSLSKMLIASWPVADDTDSAGLEGVMPLTPVLSAVSCSMSCVAIERR